MSVVGMLLIVAIVSILQPRSELSLTGPADCPCGDSGPHVNSRHFMTSIITTSEAISTSFHAFMFSNVSFTTIVIFLQFSKQCVISILCDIPLVHFKPFDISLDESSFLYIYT